jgi:nitrate reductase delta subunit
MLAPFKMDPDRVEAASRVKAWTRGRFSLSSDSTILVSELESALPGFPPLHTVVAFWTAERKHYHFRIFKPLSQVVQEDLPPAWYRDALAVTEGLQCDCC